MRNLPTRNPAPATPAEPPPPPPLSVLGAARVRRRWTIDEAAARSDLDPEVIEALEEARVYRFETTQDALAAAVVYATALGLEQREARLLVGLPVRPRAVALILSRRSLSVLTFVAMLAALAWFVAVPRLRSDAPAVGLAATTSSATRTGADTELPQPWQIQVLVYNGSPRPNAATEMANRIAGLSYRIGGVTEAPRHDYPETRVYFAPGGDAIAARLARSLGVKTEALPGGDNPRRVVVIVGARS
jgi:hypothetical protein